jgi:hypothetical protein
VLATTISAQGCPDTAMLQADKEQQTPVAPGCRGSKPPAASRPGWLQKPARMAALARLTVIGWLVSSIIQRQGRLDLRTHAQQSPGNQGAPAMPTAAVVVAWFAQIALVPFWIGEHEGGQIAGVQPQPLWSCDALGVDHAWYAAPSVHKIDQVSQSP